MHLDMVSHAGGITFYHNTTLVSLCAGVHTPDIGAPIVFCVLSADSLSANYRRCVFCQLIICQLTIDLDRRLVCSTGLSLPSV